MALGKTNVHDEEIIADTYLGSPREKDPDRPSLILRRAGEQGLWDMAKAAGTTVDVIRRANGLTEEPAPGSMLLIPVP